MIFSTFMGCRTLVGLIQLKGSHNQQNATADCQQCRNISGPTTCECIVWCW